MKPALRLAALAGIPSVFVWTHDSLALGEDGPTHQPVEQLVTLRATPNFWVLRPADGYETARCWELAWQRRAGPSGLVLTRQSVPALPLRGAVERGGYVLVEGSSATLLASGSEVHLCLEASRRLARQGIATRVVSLPCWELFLEQDESYQATVLGRAPRIAVECASPLGWQRWAQRVVGLERFGASGPGDALMSLYGFTVEAVVSEVEAAVAANAAV